MSTFIVLSILTTIIMVVSRLSFLYACSLPAFLLIFTISIATCLLLISNCIACWILLHLLVSRRRVNLPCRRHLLRLLLLKTLILLFSALFMGISRLFLLRLVFFPLLLLLLVGIEGSLQVGRQCLLPPSALPLSPPLFSVSSVALLVTSVTPPFRFSIVSLSRPLIS